MRPRRGFTLVELLVVIGLIAVLIGVLLPSLRRARSSANRAICLGNQREILTAINLYANQNKGWLPPGITGGNISGGDIIYNDPADTNNGWTSAPPFCRPWNSNGWTMLGYLFSSNAIKDPRVFYCPETRTGKVYPYAWESVWRKWTSYLYRYSDLGKDIGPNLWPPGPKFGRRGLKSTTAIICDHFGYPDAALMTWPHASPWGIVVGYADGHAQYWVMKRQDNETIAKLNSLAKSDVYITLMFQGFDTGDFTAARAAFP